MARFIPKDKIQEIYDKNDIYDIISSYLPLNKVGNRWKALCPFHKEKTPSFVVSPEKQAFYCFGCGKGGNIFSFIMEKENVDFLNAAHILANRSGIVIPEQQNTSDSKKTEFQHKSRQRLFQLHQTITDLYNKTLLSDKGKPGLNYLLKRNINYEIIKKFKLGFAPPSWNYTIQYAKDSGFKKQELITAGLAIEKKEAGISYDRFRNRIMFPIWNEQGKVVAFSGRTIENEPKGGKYINSPETPVFKKKNTLYALPFARTGMKEKKSAIICEGQLDVIAMHTAGYNNTIAPQGTAFTEEQARTLKRYTNKVYLCFDADKAGIDATYKAIDILLPFDFEIKVLPIQEGEDPQSLYNQNGTESINNLIKKSKDFFDFLYEENTKYNDPNTPHGKNSIVKNIIQKISLIDNQIIRSSYISSLASRLSIPQNAVFKELNKILNSQKLYYPANNKQEKETKKTSANSYTNPLVEKALETLLELTINNENTGRQIDELLEPELISNLTLGKALNLAVSLTINGEWENITKELNLFLNENPSELISKILTSSNNLTENFNYEKAALDCVNKIKLVKLDEQIAELKKQLSNSSDDNQRKELLNKITKLQKEKKDINKN